MIYHIEFDIAAVFLTLFIMYYIIFKKGLSRHSNRVYMGMLFLNFLAEISDIFSSIANNNTHIFNIFFQDFWNYIYILTHNFLGYVFMLYVFYLIGYEKRKKTTLKILAIPFAIEVIILATNPFHKLFFYYNENDQYTHGKLFFIIYAIAFAYMVFAIYLSIRHRKSLTKARSSALLFFITITFVPLMIQVIFPEYLLTLFFETIGLMGILFTIENKNDVINPTTGILNRYALEAALDKAMMSKGNVLISIKLPNLNYYNKMIGFENMNGILHRISNWMEISFDRYSCYDCGRGHFVILCEGVTENQVDDIRKRTLERFESAWGKGQFSLRFPVQFGVIHIPEDVKTMENIFMLIDAPFDGKTTSELDVAKAVSRYERTVLVERLIDKAVRNKSFQVYYQPIWNYKDGKVRSAEALCRLFDDEYGMIPPDEFIPASERNGAILEIGKMVFEEVCRFYQEGRLKALGIEYVEVNLSVVQCMSRDLEKIFEEILQKYSLNASCINLEITESATAENRKLLIDKIDILRAQGFSFSLDDYGTGYSNISYMYEMPFNIIKIDKSILWKAIDPETGKGQSNALIYLENTIRMLKEMNYCVLVEGVESLEQKLFLEEHECDYLQGYYFSKPVHEKVFADYLKVVNA
ncbi:MAG: EAL domain-containing protein [Clostridiales bacterium]|nr:EAL domain-containing protein [Clostridiales bacterium]